MSSTFGTNVALRLSSAGSCSAPALASREVGSPVSGGGRSLQSPAGDDPSPVWEEGTSLPTEDAADQRLDADTGAHDHDSQATMPAETPAEPGLQSVVAALDNIRSRGGYDAGRLAPIVGQVLAMARESDAAGHGQVLADVGREIDAHRGRLLTSRPMYNAIVQSALDEFATLSLAPNAVAGPAGPPQFTSKMTEQLYRLPAVAAARVVRRLITGRPFAPEADWPDGARPHLAPGNVRLGFRGSFAPMTINEFGCWIAHTRLISGYPVIMPYREELPAGGSLGAAFSQKANRVVVRAVGSAQDLHAMFIEHHDVSHICHVRQCLRPSHLVVESRSLNLLRKACHDRRGRETVEVASAACNHMPACIFSA